MTVINRIEVCSSPEALSTSGVDVAVECFTTR